MFRKVLSDNEHRYVEQPKVHINFLRGRTDNKTVITKIADLKQRHILIRALEQRHVVFSLLICSEVFRLLCIIELLHYQRIFKMTITRTTTTTMMMNISDGDGYFLMIVFRSCKTFCFINFEKNNPRTFSADKTANEMTVATSKSRKYFGIKNGLLLSNLIWV